MAFSFFLGSKALLPTVCHWGGGLRFVDPKTIIIIALRLSGTHGSVKAAS